LIKLQVAIFTKAIVINFKKIWTEFAFYKFKTICKTVDMGGDSQNFLQKFIRFFLTLGLKILGLFRIKVLFEADIIKG